MVLVAQKKDTLNLVKSVWRILDPSNIFKQSKSQFVHQQVSDLSDPLNAKLGQQG